MMLVSRLILILQLIGQAQQQTSWLPQLVSCGRLEISAGSCKPDHASLPARIYTHSQHWLLRSMPELLLAGRHSDETDIGTHVQPLLYASTIWVPMSLGPAMLKLDRLKYTDTACSSPAWWRQT